MIICYEGLPGQGMSYQPLPQTANPKPGARTMKNSTLVLHVTADQAPRSDSDAFIRDCLVSSLVCGAKSSDILSLRKLKRSDLSDFLAGICKLFLVCPDDAASIDIVDRAYWALREQGFIRIN